MLKGINSEDFLSTEALEQETAKLEQQAAKKNAVKKALFFTGALLGIVAVVLLTLYVSWIAAFAVLVVWGVGLCAVAPTRRPEASKKLEVPTTKPIDPPVPVPALVTGPNLGEVTPNVVESYASDRRESDCSYDSDGSESDYEFDEEDTLDEDDKPLRLSP